MFIRSVRGKLLLVGGFVLLAMIINFGPRLSRLASSDEESGFSVWGANNYGQTGNGTTMFEPTEPLEQKLDLRGLRQVALGLNHSLGLAEDGKVFGWGSNLYGQIGQNTALKLKTLPTPVDGLPKITQIAANQDHSLALDAKGHVWAWGLNMSGQLGDGTNTDSAKPLRVPELDGVTQVVAGYRTSLALKRDGSLWAWGGDCRLDSARDKGFRDMVASLAVDGAYSTPSTASAKSGNYVALSPEEDCINEEVVGIRSISPKKIEGLPGLRTISAGFGHMLAIDTAGNVWAWGCNTYGQVGNGTIGRGQGANLKPAIVNGMDEAVAVAAGFRHSLVLKRDGSLWAWGHNFTGALGTGKEEDANPSPTRVSGVRTLKKIAAGHDFSLGMTPGGEVWGWGEGRTGQFAADKKLRRVPARAWNLAGAVDVIAGGGHVAAQMGRPTSDEGSGNIRR